MFSLNRQEKQAVIFFTAVVLSGIGIDYCLKAFIVPRELVRCFRDIGKIDLNRADARALEGERGIGPALAGRIIAYRERQGGFKDVEELKKIKGITRYRFEKIKDACSAGEP